MAPFLILKEIKFRLWNTIKNNTNKLKKNLKTHYEKSRIMMKLLNLHYIY